MLQTWSSVLLRTAIIATSVAVAIVTAAEFNDTSENAARRWFFNEWSTSAQIHLSRAMSALWKYNTNITEENGRLLQAANARKAEFIKLFRQTINRFNWRNFTDRNLTRIFQLLIDITGAAILPASESSRLEWLRSAMQSAYSTATVCNRPLDVGTNKSTKCYELQPGGLTKIMSESRDWNDLLWAWKGWRNATGSTIKRFYQEFVQLKNRAARMNGFRDNGHFWRARYETTGFEPLVEKLWLQIRPLYVQLHAYVRRRLMSKYWNFRHRFPLTGHIPAHITGNMWSQSWTSIAKLVKPFANITMPDITRELVRQRYNTTRIFQLAENFFTSLGLDPLPDSFWTRSMLDKPTDGRKVVCHPSAWDMLNGTDFRIKQCTEVTHDFLLTTHHELGHVQYYMNYRQLPIVFRHGANPAFHEAIGDTIALSVMTPQHLRQIGLLSDFEESYGLDINQLMSQALDKIVFLPSGYIVDLWRWKVFSGHTTPDRYNKDWWRLRCRIQGVSPPVERSEDDFDASAKYHIPSNTPYIRYFLSHVIQFQFQKALCDASNYTGPLHRCDIYRSREAGALLKRMLSMGRSRPWPEVLQLITGSSKIDAGPLLDYFRPLYEWLRRENEGHEVGWDDHCPEGSLKGDLLNDVTRATSWSPLVAVAVGLLVLSVTNER